MHDFSQINARLCGLGVCLSHSSLDEYSSYILRALCSKALSNLRVRTPTIELHMSPHLKPESFLYSFLDLKDQHSICLYPESYTVSVNPNSRMKLPPSEEIDQIVKFGITNSTSNHFIIVKDLEIVKDFEKSMELIKNWFFEYIECDPLESLVFNKIAITER